MDCRDFKEKHFAFVDDTLPGVELIGMQVHLTECDECAKQDAMVRRSLLLFRNLPSIEPSPDFSIRLQEKLRAAKLADQEANSGRARKLAATVAVTSVVMLGYIAVSLRQVDYPQDIVLPPVVATAYEPGTTPISAPGPEMVASVSAGLPIWTAALLAEQAPVHFASLDLTASAR